MNHALTINTETGLLDRVHYRPSPYQNERPQNMPIDMIVIHGISLPPGDFGSSTIEAFFCGTLDASQHPALISVAQLQVSAHLLIKRTGEFIQFVPFTARAWHAGVSCFQGKTGCNDFSIGIELEGTDTIPYELIQYQQLAQIIRLLMAFYPAITPDRIVGHADIAPGRKTDPGPVFDWRYLKGIIV